MILSSPQHHNHLLAFGLLRSRSHFQPQHGHMYQPLAIQQTKGISAQQLKSSQLWLYGPPWLTSTEEWPTWSPTNLQSIDTEDNLITQNSADHNPPQASGI